MKRLDDPDLFHSALLGNTPGEALSAYDRRVLVATLVGRGMTDVDIARHTLWTLYTVDRIREHIGLDRNVRFAPPSHRLPGETTTLETRCVFCDLVTTVTQANIRHGMCPDCAVLLGTFRAAVVRPMNREVA